MTIYKGHKIEKMGDIAIPGQFSCPTLNLFGFSTERSVKAAITRRLNDGNFARREGLLLKARTIVAIGICPDCGAHLRRNLSLTGWWQCEQYGSEGFRKDSSKPACSWQDFTE